MSGGAFDRPPSRKKPTADFDPEPTLVTAHRSATMRGVDRALMKSFLFTAGAVVSLLSVSTAIGADRHSLAVAPMSVDMQRIFSADQADRRDEINIDYTLVGPRDAARRRETQELLHAGKLTSSGDYAAAAFVFQHGSSTSDYLLAHVLAMTAVAKGDESSLWIATAALDRYLMTTGQSQVFGTQFVQAKNGKWTQEPYDRTLVSDALRAELDVPSQAAQVEQLGAIHAKTKPAAASGAGH